MRHILANHSQRLASIERQLAAQRNMEGAAEGAAIVVAGVLYGLGGLVIGFAAAGWVAHKLLE